MTAVAGTVVLIGIGTAGTELHTRVLLVLTGLDVLLVACAVALFSVLRPGRDSLVPPLLVGSLLLLTADLAAGHSVHFGGQDALDLGGAVRA